MLISIGVAFGKSWLGKIRGNHFDSSDCVNIVQPDRGTLLDVDYTLLTVLRVDAFLGVALEPVIQPSTVNVNSS